MKTSFKSGVKYLEHEDIIEKRVDLDHEDFIRLVTTGKLRELEYAGGRAVQVNVIVLRMKIGPEIG